MGAARFRWYVLWPMRVLVALPLESKMMEFLLVCGLILFATIVLWIVNELGGLS